MTNQRAFPCLKLLTTLMSIFQTMGIPIDSSRMQYHSSPLAGSGHLITDGTYYRDIANIGMPDLLSKVNTQSDYQQDYRANHFNGKFITLIEKPSTTLQEYPKTHMNIDRTTANSFPESQFQNAMHDTALYILRKYNEAKNSSLLSANAAYVKLKSQFVNDELENGPSHSPIDLRVNTKLNKLNTIVPGVGRNTIQFPVGGYQLEEETQRLSRNRFPRDAHGGVFLEDYHLFGDEAFSDFPKEEVDPDMSSLRNDLGQFLDDLTMSMKYKDDGLQISSRSSLSAPADDGYKIVAVEPYPESSFRVFSENEDKQAVTDLEIQRIRKMAEIILLPMKHTDDDNINPDEDSAEVNKRENTNRDKIYALVKQNPNYAMRAQEQDRDCKSDLNGLEPLRCPSNKHKCLSDVMICDGIQQCPSGEDEVFTLCVLRRWNLKLWYKFHLAS